MSTHHFSCGHCDIFYDAIFKYETLEDDLHFLSEVLNLPSNLADQLKKETKSAEEKKKTEDRRRSYFKTLSEEQIRVLNKVYAKDLEMFQYSPDGYGDHR